MEEEQYPEMEKIVECQYSFQQLNEPLVEQDYSPLEYNESDLLQIGDEEEQIIINSSEARKQIIETYQHKYETNQRKYLMNGMFKYQMPGISHDQPYIQVVIQRTDHNDRVVYIPMKANGNFTIGRYGDECKYITTKNGSTIDVCLSVNQIAAQDDRMANMHLEVDYSLIQMSLEPEQLNNALAHTFHHQGRYLLSANCLNKICKYMHNLSIRIKDISPSKLNSTTLISVEENSNCSKMSRGCIFQIGYVCLMTVKGHYLTLSEFFKKYCTNHQQLQDIDIVFYALQSIALAVKFLGIDQNLSQKFAQVQNKDITSPHQLRQQLDENEGLLINRLYECLTKEAILLQFEHDKMPYQYYILVQCNQAFTFGRGDGNDITLQGQQVSRCHGQIQYINNEWCIKDGAMSAQNGIWTRSTMGTWKLIQRDKYVMIEDGQRVKIGLHEFRFTRVFDQSIIVGDQQCDDEMASLLELITL